MQVIAEWSIGDNHFRLTRFQLTKSTNMWYLEERLNEKFETIYGWGNSKFHSKGPHITALAALVHLVESYQDIKNVQDQIHDER